MPSDSDERTLLIDRTVKEPAVKVTTPLPKRQLSIILIAQLCEAIAIESPTPYIPQFVRDLPITHGDPRKVGYFSGLLYTVSCLVQALVIIPWGRASDHVGRKPIILIGLVSTMISTMLFGLQRNFFPALMSWCVGCLFIGNPGVERSVIGELTDSTNRSRAISLVYLCYSVGAAAGNLLGGTLVHPERRFGVRFHTKFWIDHPYFLPGLVCSLFLVVPIIDILFAFEETGKKRVGNTDAGDVDAATLDSPRAGEPVPFRELLVYPVLFSISNYIIAVSLDTCFWAIFPLFLNIPVNIGGLGLGPSKISYIIASYQLTNAFCQYFLFVPVTRRFGDKKVFVYSTAASIPCFILLPVINTVARCFGEKTSCVWVLVGALVMCRAFFGMSYGSIYMYITAAAPNEHSLGGTHGMAQTAVLIAGGISPAVTSALFSFSIEKNVLGGNGIYLLLVCLSGLAMFWVTRLPARMWDEERYAGSVLSRED